jgi:glycerol uptake facilitator-like aquaporin
MVIALAVIIGGILGTWLAHGWWWPVPDLLSDGWGNYDYVGTGGFPYRPVSSLAAAILGGALVGLVALCGVALGRRLRRGPSAVTV